MALTAVYHIPLLKFANSRCLQLSDLTSIYKVPISESSQRYRRMSSTKPKDSTDVQILHFCSSTLNPFFTVMPSTKNSDSNPGTKGPEVAASSQMSHPVSSPRQVSAVNISAMSRQEISRPWASQHKSAGSSSMSSATGDLDPRKITICPHFLDLQITGDAGFPGPTPRCCLDPTILTISTAGFASHTYVHG